MSVLNNFNNLQLGETEKTDWYYTFGLTLSYTKYTVNCPGNHPKN